MQDFEGKAIDRYHVLEPLGKGGMAIVYRAFDTRLNRDVAIKLIRTDAIPAEQHQQLIRRFEREAQSMAKFSHPNIIPVHDYGEFEGVPYLVMDYLPGGTLKQFTGKPMDYRKAAGLLFPIAEALAYAHSQGVIHRDVKPSNIMVTQVGNVMLTDFGIAKLLEDQEATALTGTGSGVGTPQYMAPEQWKNQVSPRTDIYALGIIFYELITGKKPYDADTPAAIAIMQATEPLPRPKMFVPSLPDAVERVLLKTLALNPENRYSSMSEFAGVLSQLSMGTVVSPPELPGEAGTTKKKTPWVLLTGIAIVLLIAAFAGVFWIISLLREPTGSAQVLTTVTAEALIDEEERPVTETSTAEPEYPTGTPTVIRAQATDTPTPTATEEALGIGSSVTRGTDGMVMMYVPAGEFTMGSNDGRDNEKPEHLVYLDGFWIDKYEVSNAQFNQFMTETSYQTSAEKNGASWVFVGSDYKELKGADWLHPQGPSSTNAGLGNHPVLHMSAVDAAAYCAWAGGRLPTEAEWEKTARGIDQRKYPWGNEKPNCAIVNYWEGENGCVGMTSEAGHYPSGVSPYGVFDMAGNVWEWVNDWYDSSYYANSGNRNPSGPSIGEDRVLRGGAWGSSANYMISTYRNWSDPGSSSVISGFRCVMEAD